MTLAIKNLREEAGLSQQQVAEKVGVHFNTIDNWEDGTTEPKASQIMKLSEVFGVSAEAVMGLPEQPGDETE